RPLGVSQNESVHPKLESQPSPDENPESQQTLDHWRPVLDYDAFVANADLFVAADLPGPNDVDAMTMEPLTAVDDASFIPRIKNNMNVPKWLKDLL
ncbi:hypothetical protein ABIB00_004607, partial [Bradyrhizobium sp. LB14.3]|uniref:hypothetical protein n=1 Tax=Bradyrhizobium sp. LB14.3 TaxID=3156328 RepID=UPI00339B104E